VSIGSVPVGSCTTGPAPISHPPLEGETGVRKGLWVMSPRPEIPTPAGPPSWVTNGATVREISFQRVVFPAQLSMVTRIMTTAPLRGARDGLLASPHGSEGPPLGAPASR
jgi:hypothetical protein